MSIALSHDSCRWVTLHQYPIRQQHRAYLQSRTWKGSCTWLVSTVLCYVCLVQRVEKNTYPSILNIVPIRYALQYDWTGSRAFSRAHLLFVSSNVCVDVHSSMPCHTHDILIWILMSFDRISPNFSHTDPNHCLTWKRDIRVVWLTECALICLHMQMTCSFIRGTMLLCMGEICLANIL